MGGIWPRDLSYNAFSYKEKVKTHNYTNRQNQSTTGKLWKRNDPDLVQALCMYWIWEIKYDLLAYGIVFLLQLHQYLFI
jgi:hypothetical protein